MATISRLPFYTCYRDACVRPATHEVRAEDGILVGRYCSEHASDVCGEVTADEATEYVLRRRPRTSRSCSDAV